jgi:hypothetical protein
MSKKATITPRMPRQTSHMVLHHLSSFLTII